MEAFYSGLALLAVSGLGWFAYQHPKGFFPIGCAILAFSLMLSAYLVGFQNGGQEAITLTRGTEDNTALVAMDDLRRAMIRMGKINILAIMAAGYMVILLTLPFWKSIGSKFAE